jgi:hypothetical protein
VENPIVSVLTLGAGTTPAIGLSGTAPISIVRALDSDICIACGSGVAWLAGTDSFRLDRAIVSNVLLSESNTLEATGASHKALHSDLKFTPEVSTANPSYERPIHSDIYTSTSLSLQTHAGRLNPIASDIDLGKYVALFGEARAQRAINGIVTAGNDGKGGIEVNAMLRKTFDNPPIGELSLLSGTGDVLFDGKALMARTSSTLELLVIGRRLRTYTYRITFSLEPTFTQPEQIWLQRSWNQHVSRGIVQRGEIIPLQTSRGSEEELTLQLPLTSSDTTQFNQSATSWFLAEANDDYGERHVLATGSFSIAPGVFVV